MDIVKALRDESFDEASEARGVNPITISDQNNRLRAIFVGGSGSRGLQGVIRSVLGLLSFAVAVSAAATGPPAEEDFLEIGDQARWQ